MAEKKGKEKKQPSRRIWFIDTEVWDKPLKLCIVLGDAIVDMGEEKIGALGSFQPQENEMWINGYDYINNIIHELFEGCSLLVGCHFKETLEGQAFMFMSHLQFNDIINRTGYAFIKLSNFVQDLFETERNKIIRPTKYLNNLVKNKVVEYREEF